MHALRSSQAAPENQRDETREAALWHEWRTGGSDAVRGQLIALHMPFAQAVATAYFSKRLPDEFGFGDFLQLASLGLIESVDRFDPSLGTQFRAFAAWRLHGVLVDGIECMTEVQQQLAAQERLGPQRRAASEAGGTRQPQEFLEYVAQAEFAFALSWLLGSTGMLRIEGSTHALPFYESAELRERRERIVALVNALPQQERKVVRHHYFQERPFNEIAESMKLTKGRISQIHKSALTRLREALEDRQECDSPAL